MSDCKKMGISMFVIAGVVEIVGAVEMFSCWPQGAYCFLVMTLIALLEFMFGCFWMMLDKI